MPYPALVAAIQRQASLKLAHLVALRFASGTLYVWTGIGPFRDAKGQVWQGIGQLGQVGDFDRLLVSGATPTLTLSGVDPAVAKRALAASAEVKGRVFEIFEQYFDADTSQPVDVPQSLYVGVMDTAKTKTTATTATVAVTTVTLIHRRRRVGLSDLSDASQQALHPGDTGCSEIARLVQATEIWPGYNG